MKKLIASLFLLAAAVVLAAPVTNVPITGLPEGTKFSAASNWMVIVTNGPAPITVKMSPQSLLTNLSGLPAWTNLITLATSNTAYVAAGSNATVVTNTVGGARIYTVSSTATGSGTNMVLTNSTSSQTWNVEQFGAKHDGKIATYVTIPTGTNYLIAVNSPFSAGDTGKVISVYLAGAASNNYTTTISNVVGITAVSLSGNAPRGVTNVSAVFGSDDTASIQAGIDTVCTNGGGTLYFPAGIYIVNGPIIDPNTNDCMHYENVAPSYYPRTNFGINAQLFTPIVQPVGWTIPTFKMQGPIAVTPKEPGSPGGNIFSAYGATIWSTLADANGGQVFACEAKSNYVIGAGCDFQRHINGLRIEIENMTWRLPADPNGSGIDLRGAPTCRIKDVEVDLGWMQYASPKPTHSNSFGIWLPQSFNQSISMVDGLVVIGFYNGIGGGEHSQAGNINVWNCWNGINWVNSAGHLCQFDRLDFQNVHHYLVGGKCLSVRLLANISSENVSTGTNLFGYYCWDYPAGDKPSVIFDPWNTLAGEITYEHSGTNAAESLEPMDMTGGDYVTVYQFTDSKAKLPVKEVRVPGLQVNQHTNTVTYPVEFNLSPGGYVKFQQTNDLNPVTFQMKTEANGYWAMQKRQLSDGGGGFRIYASTNLNPPEYQLDLDAINRYAIFYGTIFASNMVINNAPDSPSPALLVNLQTNSYVLFQKANDCSPVTIQLKTEPNSFWGIQKRQQSDGLGGFKLYSSTNAALELDDRMQISSLYGDVWFYGNVISNGPVAWVNTTNNGAGNGSILTSINGEWWIRTGGAWRKIIDNKSIYSEITNGFIAGDGSGKLMATNIYTFPTNLSISATAIDLNKTYQYTNAAGAIEFTGLLNVENDKCKTANLLINANGSDRLVTIPGNWMNHEDATTFTVTNGWFAELTVKCYGNAWTSAVWLLIK